MFSINGEFYGLDMSVNLPEGVNDIDLDRSGSGKTFLMQIIGSYCVLNGIEYRYFNYNMCASDVEAALLKLEDKFSVVCFDNADQYMTKEMSLLLNNFKNIVFIVSMKYTVDFYAKSRYCRLTYEGNIMKCEVVSGRGLTV